MGIALGSAADHSRLEPPRMWRGYHVLEADFHVHSFMGDGALAPWDLIGEARRQGLHAFAITNHNQVFAARLGRWLSRRIGGPIVLVGEEVTAPAYHIAAVGIEERVNWRGSAAEAVDAIHAQGGAAIAAHPFAKFWAGFDEHALRQLDGAERVHPILFSHPKERREVQDFFEGAAAGGRTLPPIGSSDFHSMMALGLTRTYVFVSEISERGVVGALRAGRVVTVDEDGVRRGDRTLVEAVDATAAQRWRRRPADWTGVLERASSLCGWLGLVGLTLFGVRRSDLGGA